MAGLWRNICDVFWSESVWLPPNVTWTDIAPGAREDVTPTDYRHLYFPLPMAFVLLSIRYFLEKYVRENIIIQFILSPIYRYWFAPVGISLGIKNSRPKKAPSNPTLEKAFLSNRKLLKHKQVSGNLKVYSFYSIVLIEIITLGRYKD